MNSLARGESYKGDRMQVLHDFAPAPEWCVWFRTSHSHFIENSEQPSEGSRSIPEASQTSPAPSPRSLSECDHVPNRHCHWRDFSADQTAQILGRQPRFWFSWAVFSSSILSGDSKPMKTSRIHVRKTF